MQPVWLYATSSTKPMPTTAMAGLSTLRMGHDLPCFPHDRMRVDALEALRVDLADVLGARGPGRKPAVLRYNFQTANRSLIAWRPGQLGGDWARPPDPTPWRRPTALAILLSFRDGWRVDARVVRYRLRRVRARHTLGLMEGSFGEWFPKMVLFDIGKSRSPANHCVDCARYGMTVLQVSDHELC